ncbi:MAG: hypothetical protein Q4B08_08175 [Propionibacteriaceae bacterium]|nr:hypothetical protein [Propionibacteriaceae bacterium]
MSAHLTSRPLTQTDRDVLSCFRLRGSWSRNEILARCYPPDRSAQQRGPRDIDRLIRDGYLRQDPYGALVLDDRGIEFAHKGGVA